MWLTNIFCCHGNCSGGLYVCAECVYKLFVQSDAHIHHHCQETHNNNISITCG